MTTKNGEGGKVDADRTDAFSAAIRAAQRELGAKYNLPRQDWPDIVPTVQDVRRHLGMSSKSSKSSLYERSWRGLVEQARREGRLV